MTVKRSARHNVRANWITYTRVADIPIVLVRTGDNWTKPAWNGGGFSLYLTDARLGDELWRHVAEAGERFGVAPAGPSERWRIEEGIYGYGADITLENNPFEVTGLEDFVEEQEREYVGKKALDHLRDLEVQHKLVGIELDPPAIHAASDLWPVEIGRLRAGMVTSAVHSPRLGRNLGFAWVPGRSSSIGTRLTVLTPTGARGAEVVPLPFDSRLDQEEAYRYPQAG